MCIILVATIGAPATHYVRPSFEIFPFSTIAADVSSHFSTSQG